jgi:hypothetical protein
MSKFTKHYLVLAIIAIGLSFCFLFLFAATYSNIYAMAGDCCTICGDDGDCCHCDCVCTTSCTCYYCWERPSECPGSGERCCLCEK